jgi:dihydroneopterin aldolase
MTEPVTRAATGVASDAGRDRSRADAALDIIFIRDIRIETLIGAYEFERREPRILHLDIEIGRAAIRACKTDRLADTIDYAAVVVAVREVFGSHKFHLLESLAEMLAELILGRFKADWVRIELAKNGIVENAGDVGVRIERAR